MNSQDDNKDVQQAHDYLLSIGDICVRFTEVKRAPRYPNGSRESDVEHSFHLALSAAELAADYYPELDTGLVAQFSLLHDLPELYSGDVWTINISDEDRQKKEVAEEAATKRLINELPPHTAKLLLRYEKQQEPEARFVRFVDKLLPDIIIIVANEASSFKEDHGISDAESLNIISEAFALKLKSMFPEFEFLHLIRDQVSKTSSSHLFKN